MSWKTVLKSDMRERMELELEQLLRDKFDHNNFNSWINHPWWGPDWYDRGLVINVWYHDNYEKERTAEEIFEAGDGHFEIHFHPHPSKSQEHFAEAKYSLEGGFEVHEFNPEILDIDELKTVINGLRG